MLLFLVFWLALSLVFSVVKVRGVDFKPFLLIVRASPERLERALARLTSRRAKAWAVVLDAGVAVGFGMMAFSLYFLALNLIRRFTSPRSFVAVAPPIPGVLFPLEVAPHFIAALSVAVVIHELAHAIASRLAGVRIKSVGAALLAVILAAFVELDEEDVRRTGLSEKLRIFAAGSFANLALFLLLLVAFTALFQPGGVLIRHVEPSTPAYTAGITRDCVIKQLNDTSIASALDLHEFMEGTRPNQTVVVGFLDPAGSWRRVVVKTASHPLNSSKGFLGVLPVDFYELRMAALPPSFLVHLHAFYAWLEIILFSLAVFNMLPIAVADGGRMVQAAASELLKGGEGAARRLVAVLTALSACLVVSNIVLTLAP